MWAVIMGVICGSWTVPWLSSTTVLGELVSNLLGKHPGQHILTLLTSSWPVDFRVSRTDVLARYVNFVAGLRNSPSMEVRVMCGVVAGDVRTTTGRNLSFLRAESGLEPLSCSSGKIKAVLGSKLAMAPDMDKWRIKYLAKLLEERGQVHYEGC